MKRRTNIEKVFDFTRICEKLIETRRYKNTPLMKEKESVADHSWKLATMSLVIGKILDLKIDSEKALKIALTHDLVEAICDDVDYFLVFTGVVSPEEKEAKEAKAIKKINKSLPLDIGQEIEELWEEYQYGKTPEGKYIKALDKIEGIDHMIYRKVIDHPDKIATYADKAVLNFPELRPILREVKIRLKKLYQDLNVDWKKEYDLV